MTTNTQSLRGILYYLSSAASFSLMNVFISELTQSVDSMQIVFIRNVMATFIILPFMLRLGGDAFKTQRLPSHFWRATVGIIGMQSWFYAISLMPLNQATALSFTSPIFAAIFAIIFLGERAGMHRWSAIIIGFVGAMVIIRPDIEGFDSNAFIVLGATAAWATASLLIKSLTTTEPALRIVFYMSCIMSLWSLPPGVYVWQPMSEMQWVYVSFAAIASVVAQLFLTRALGAADIVILMPFDFSRLVFTAILTYIAFGEISDVTTWIGGLIIITAAAYIAHREALHKKHIAQPGTQDG